ncbi:MAG TPA: sugar phosphate nucleotidyltransferase [Candidatus Binatia bacterium]|nr:sugar phosphate nucleotidyltransferase [Candidatus Binatia bacterium]
MESEPELWALVLAGGDGTRLQGLTRRVAGAPIPKQYCRLLGDRTLLEATLDRVRAIAPPGRTVAIVNRDHLPLARGQLATLPAENVLVQPRNRDTGPGLLLSLLALARRDPRALVAVFPSDHYVAAPEVLAVHVRTAARTAALLPAKVALLGIPPERPDAEYGYIEPGMPVGAGATAFHVAAFWEKPDVPTARGIIARGGLWNAFLLVGRIGRLLELLAIARPADFERLWSAADDAERLAATYAALAPWNFSRDFLAEAADHLVVEPAVGTGWSDWGTPESVLRTLRALRQPPPWESAAPAPAA